MTLNEFDREAVVEVRNVVEVKFWNRLRKFVYNFINDADIYEPRERKSEALRICTKMMENSDFVLAYCQSREQMVSDYKNSTRDICIEDCDVYFDWDYIDTIIPDYLSDDEDFDCVY